MSIKDIARSVMPAALRRWRTSLNLARQRRRNASRTAQDVFSEIYAKNLWGEGRGERIVREAVPANVKAMRTSRM